MEISQKIKDIKKICLFARSQSWGEFRKISVDDLVVYWKINDHLTELEKMLETKKEFNHYQVFFSKKKISNSWVNENWESKEVKLVNILNEAGRLALTNYDTDIRIRKVAKKDKENYETIFKYIWEIKDLLNIQPRKEDNFPTGDYRYPSFGFVYSWAERVAKGEDE